MIRITRQTDYAVMLLADMAALPFEEVHNAKDAAHRTGLPTPMVSKILKALARARLLVSHRGVKGGYSLARLPERITVAEIIGALEGPIGITACTHAPGSCEQEPCCRVRPNWYRINVTLREALTQVSLADMLAPPNPPLLRVETALEIHPAPVSGS